MNLTQTTLPGLKTHWTRLAQISVWMSSIVLTFQATPPRHSTAVESYIWIGMVQFLLAVVLGLTIGLLAKRSTTKAPWQRASAICLLIGFAGFFANMRAIDLWTCAFDGRGPMIIGETLTLNGMDYLRTHPLASCTQMLQDFAGNNTMIWNAIEISTRRSMLTALFLIVVLAFSLSAVLMLESLQLSRNSRNQP